MGIQGMQASLRNNKRERKSIFDNKKEIKKSTYKGFVDHMKMTTYEFHEFQKKLKKDNTERQKIFIIKSVISISIFIAIVIYFLFFYKV
ncbi:MAG: hypothetical protein COB12_13345 [Flavobacterium sp.]|nr:MAG: hypothetical protein COB12_13345 [Flavobacterium sp.]